MRRRASGPSRRFTGVLVALMAFVGTLGADLALAPSVSAAPNPAASLDQCANGGVGAPLEPCLTGTLGGTSYANWVNGDVNGQKAHWREGDLLPYRANLTGLFGGSNTGDNTCGTVHGGKNAIDYLGSFDTTETTATAPTQFHANNNNPCVDQLGSAPGSGCTAPGTPPTPAATTPVTAFSRSNANLTSCDAADVAGTFTGTQVPGTFDLFAPSAATGTFPAGPTPAPFTYVSEDVPVG